MTKFGWVVAVGAAVFVGGLAGCVAAQPDVEKADNGPTWEDAKAAAQAKALEIVDLIPTESVVSVDQHETGALFSCSEKRHRWAGVTYVTLVPGADIESITKKMESRLDELLHDRGDFSVTNRRDMFGDYQVTAKSSVTKEAYLFGEWEPGTISIDSWSVCFTLPEGTYPGGSF